jgi:Rhomboid family
MFQLQVTPTSFWITLFGSTFIHPGRAHILGNMLFLFAVGLHVERWMAGLPKSRLLSDLRLGRGSCSAREVAELGARVVGPSALKISR